MSEERESQGMRIPMDGTFGPGILCELTIYTRVKTDSGDYREKEERFTVPFMLLDNEKLNIMNNLHLIMGYRVVKEDRPTALKELGL